MPEQKIKIIRAPEHPSIDLEDLERWLWVNYPKSEWKVEEIHEHCEIRLSKLVLSD